MIKNATYQFAFEKYPEECEEFSEAFQVFDIEYPKYKFR